MSLNTLLGTLDITPRLAVIPVGAQHLSYGDPRTPEGRAGLAAQSSLRNAALIIDVHYDAASLTGNQTFSTIVLGLAAQWLISVDETGDAFVPRTEETMFFGAITAEGTWDDENQESFLTTELEEEDTPLFLFEGTLYGDDIAVTLGEIYAHKAFSQAWSDTSSNTMVLPPKPALMALFVAKMMETSLSSEKRDLLTAAFAYILKDVDESKNARGAMIGTWCDWIRDKSFAHGPNRAAALWTPEDEQTAQDLVATLPAEDKPWALFINDGTETISAHQKLSVECMRATSRAHINTLFKKDAA